MALTTIDDRGLKTPIDLLDNEKIRFGTGNDLEIHHDGSQSIINDTANRLQIRSDHIELMTATGKNEYYLQATEDGAVELYHNNGVKFATKSSGVTISGTTSTILGDLHFNNDTNGGKDLLWDESANSLIHYDDVKAAFGIDSDLQIYHDGTDNYIYSDNKTLYLNANGSTISINPVNAENSARFLANGAVELYYDSSKKFETTSEGVETQGELHFKAPSSTTGEQVGRLEWWNENDAGVMAKIAVDRTAGSLAPADLVFSTSANVDTTANGGDGDITERLRITSAGDINIPVDGDKLQFGASQDLQLYHDATNSNNKIQFDQQLLFRSHGSGGTYENSAAFNPNGSVDLYYNDVKKLETTSTGVTVTGRCNLTTDLNMTTADDQKIYLGAGNDLQIYHDGSNSYVEDSGTGKLILKSNGTHVQVFAAGFDVNNAAGTETQIECDEDSGVKLYYDNVKHFETNSGGCKVNDNKYMGFGNGNDLQIYHDGTDSYLENGTGIISIRSASGHSGKVKLQPKYGENSLTCDPDGAVTLYYNNSKKFETDSNGCVITGELRAYTSVSDSDWTSGNRHVIQQGAGATSAFVIEHSHDSEPYGLMIDFSDDAPDNNSQWFMSCDDSSANRFKIWSDGDVDNHDNSYGAISDIKLKENVVDAKSQWDDVKAVKVRNFNFKDKKDKTLLGVVAQEIETISPGLVNESPDQDKYNKDLGTTTKSVKYSILYMKAFKALQEAMAKIETLETKVAALEAK